MPLNEFGPMVLWASLLIAAGLGAVLALLVRTRAKLGWWVVAACVPVYIAAIAFPGFTLWGWHGMLHQSYALACLRSMPPEDPLVAGYPLKYAWVAHWVIGHAAQLVHLSPLILIAVLDAVVLPLSALFTALAARRLTSNRIAIGLAGVLGVWGVSVVHGTPLQQVVKMIGPWVRLDPRPVPIDKFFNPNQNEFGVMFSAGALWCLLSALTSERFPWRWIIGLAAFTMAAAFVYPISWAGIGLMIAGGGACVIVLTRGRDQWRAIWCGLAAALATLPCVPYLISVGDGKNPWAQMKLGPDATVLAEVLPSVILFGLPAMIVAWMARERMREAWREHRAACAFVLGATGALLLAAFVIRVPTSAEYKWLLQSCGPLACMLGLGGAAIVERRRWTAWPLCAALCLGAGSKLAYRADWPLTEPLAFDGEYVRVGDSRLREALAWMRGNLPIDAVVISREAAVATSAGRSLAMGPDRVGRFAQHVIWNGVDDDRPSLDRDEEHAKAMRHDGWMINATTMGVYMLGHSTKFVYARRNIVESVLASDWPIRLDITMASIAREFRSRPVYVLTERADVVSKLIASGRFENRYAAQGWTILQVR